MKWLPFIKSYTVKCPNGEMKEVYKRAEDAFPLFVTGHDANITTDLKDLLGSEVAINANYKRNIESLLIGLNELNGSSMMGFRAAYIGYKSDPCSNNQFLLDEIQKINEEQRLLSALKLQIRGYVDLVKSGTAEAPVLAQTYSNLVTKIGTSTMGNEGKKVIAQDAAIAIDEAKSAASKMMAPPL